MEIINRTPFSVFPTVLNDKAGRDFLIIIVKCTYSFALDKLQPALEQAPVTLVDQFYGEPGSSSIAFPSDLVPWKAGGDLLLRGTVLGKRGRETETQVSLKVGSLEQTLCIFGQRYWRSVFGFYRPSDPEPFEPIPLKYEHAFGGFDTSNPEPRFHERDRRNPVGCGFYAKKTKIYLDDISLPNIEDPRCLIKGCNDRPQPAGFGAICLDWEPRIRYGGTYDEAWETSRCPMLPEDFNDRYYNCSHPRCFSETFFKGDEAIQIVNVGPKDKIAFTLPADRFNVSVMIRDAAVQCMLACDTVFIDCDENRVMTVWRGSVDAHNNIHHIRSVEIAGVS
jgi:hypothetical protein